MGGYLSSSVIGGDTYLCPASRSDDLTQQLRRQPKKPEGRAFVWDALGPLDRSLITKKNEAKRRVDHGYI